MIIIPAIDIIDGKCVRLSKGDFNSKKIYSDNPLSVAKNFEAHGFKRLHLVDLDGARAGMVKNWSVLEAIAANTSMAIDFSGGISDTASVTRVFESGASFVAIGSMAVKDENLVADWLKQWPPSNFLIGADLKNGKIAINGWEQGTELDWKTLIRTYSDRGINQFFCTDVSKDGLLEGPAIELYKEIIAAFPGIGLIASGGVGSVGDLEKLRDTGCAGAIVGRAIYENRISLKELEPYNS